MQIEDLTIGQARQIAEMFGKAPAAASPAAHLMGHYVIIRSRDSGVHAGTLMYHAGREVRLADSRRLWFWKAAKGHTLSAVANYGLGGGSKIAAPVSEIVILDACEIIPTTADAALSIKGAAEHDPA